MIPWLLIVVGGVMIYSGVKGENPLEIVKGIVSGGNDG